MVQLVGNYKFESQDNFKEYLVSLGIPEEQATKLSSDHEDSVIGAVDAESITALHAGNAVKYPFNKELEHTLPTGHKVWTYTTIKDNVVTSKTKLNKEGTLVDEKVSVFTDAGLTITSTNTKGVVAVRKYKRE